MAGPGYVVELKFSTRHSCPLDISSLSGFSSNLSRFRHSRYVQLSSNVFGPGEAARVYELHQNQYCLYSRSRWCQQTQLSSYPDVPPWLWPVLWRVAPLHVFWFYVWHLVSTITRALTIHLIITICGDGSHPAVNYFRPSKYRGITPAVLNPVLMFYF